jgi:fused signal recognition particle receptor
MEIVFADILYTITNVYETSPPEYWLMLTVLLLFILLLTRIRRFKLNKDHEDEIIIEKDVSEDSVDEEVDDVLEESVIDLPEEISQQEVYDGKTVDIGSVDIDEETSAVVEEGIAEGVDEPEEEVIDQEKFEFDEEMASEDSPELLVDDVPEPVSFFNRLKNGLSKTRDAFSSGLERVLSGGREIDDDLLEDLEELLITSDIGVSTSMDLINRISKKSKSISEPDQLKAILKDEILSYIDIQKGQKEELKEKPHVILVVGVNGVGKTTTIGKLALKYSQQGKKVLIVAGDTFRAAAVEQLTIWAERCGAEIVKHKENSDPAAVAYDGIEAAVARDIDVVLVDTAGRLHTKVNLMDELKKIKRTVAGKLPDSPHETLIVLDATTGQNALSQAELFHEAIGITGAVLTKLDGTAKGGIVISICNSLNIPLKYIGIGEKGEDLQDFDPVQFVNALF